MQTTLTFDDDDGGDRQKLEACRKAMADLEAQPLPLSTVAMKGVGTKTLPEILTKIVSTASPHRRKYMTLATEKVTYHTLLDAGLQAGSLGGLHSALERAWKAEGGKQFAPQLVVTEKTAAGTVHYVPENLVDALMETLGH